MCCQAYTHSALTVGQGISWRWLYWIACIFIGIVLIAIVLFMEETQYDRHLHPVPRPTSTGVRRRLEGLIGIEGARMAKYRPSWYSCVSDVFAIFWKPAVLLPLLYIMWAFGFGIGCVSFLSTFVTCTSKSLADNSLFLPAFNLESRLRSAQYQRYQRRVSRVDCSPHAPD